MRIWICVLWLAIIAPASAADLKIGRAAVDITPPAGMPLEGYYYIRLNTAMHDPLYAGSVKLFV
jgi:hypothetical protein